MFDFSKLRTLNLDNLRPWVIFEIQQPIRTRDGRLCEPGMEFRFEYAIANALTRDAEIHGLGPNDEELIFDAKAGEYRQWFENSGREWRPGKPAPIPPTPEQIAEAEALIAGLKPLEASKGEPNWGTSRAEGDELLASAQAMARTGRADLAAALAQKALNHYYAYTSQATSGGEGTALQHEVRDDVAAARRLIEEGSRPG
jgi:hypothetical protein